jgi:hypothetical protein
MAMDHLKNERENRSLGAPGDRRPRGDRALLPPPEIRDRIEGRDGRSDLRRLGLNQPSLTGQIVLSVVLTT